MVVAASGGSTNGALHLPAMAHEAGIDFDLHAVGEIFKRTPYIGDFKPGGRYRDEGPARVGRRAGADEGAARRRLSPRRLHDRHRQDHRRESARTWWCARTRTWCARPPRRCRRPAAWSCSRAISRRRARIVQGRGHAGHCSSGSAGRRAASTARRTASPRSRRANTSRATCWSSATRARAAAPACARCSRPRRRSTARARATRWR